METNSEAGGHGAAGLHNVYTQRETVEYFQQHGKFPDGAVIIKELLKAVTAPYDDWDREPRQWSGRMVYYGQGYKRTLRFQSALESLCEISKPCKSPLKKSLAACRLSRTN